MMANYTENPENRPQQLVAKEICISSQIVPAPKKSLPPSSGIRIIRDSQQDTGIYSLAIDGVGPLSQTEVANSFFCYLANELQNHFQREDQEEHYTDKEKCKPTSHGPDYCNIEELKPYDNHRLAFSYSIRVVAGQLKIRFLRNYSGEILPHILYDDKPRQRYLDDDEADKLMQTIFDIYEQRISAFIKEKQQLNPENPDLFGPFEHLP